MYLISVMISTFSIRDFGTPLILEIPIWTPCYENPGKVPAGRWIRGAATKWMINPSYAEATFISSTTTQRFLKTT